MENLELSGIWWLPNNYDNYVHGILKFNSEDGAYLELMGQISGYKELEADIILGRTANGKDITLYKCFETKKTFSSGGFPTTTVFANIIFDGVHFNKEEDIRFKELSCHYSNLDEWAWMNGINIAQPESGKIEIRYENPPVIKVDISQAYTIELYSITKSPTYSMVQKEASIIQKIYIKLINNELDSFEKHLDKLNHMKNFISLGVGVSVRTINFIGKTEENKKDLEGYITYPKVTIYFATKYSANDYKEVLPPRMLFTLRDIRDDFDSVIKKWFNKREYLKPVFDLYFGTVYNSDMYLEQKFLSLIQAIESYHRRTKSNNEIEPKAHEKRVNSIIQSVDKEYKEWIEKRLGYSNEPTLRSRLRDLLEDCGLLLNLDSSRKKKSFISKVCDTRNYFTHYDVSLSDRAAKEMELFDIYTKLKIIIEYNLLLEVGFNCGEVNYLIEGKYKSYNLS